MPYKEEFMNKKNEEIEELQQVSCCGSPVGAIYKRKYGEEQPYMKLGPFKLRLPFIHYRFESLVNGYNKWITL